jgi:hypothetical protein
MYNKFAYPSQQRKSSAARHGKTGNPYAMPGVDFRTPRGRRYRDLVDAVLAEFPHASADAVRELAGLRFSFEELQAQIISGADSRERAHGDAVRCANLIGRRENDLRAAHKEKSVAHRRGPTIDDFLARHEDGDDE